MTENPIVLNVLHLRKRLQLFQKVIIYSDFRVSRERDPRISLQLWQPPSEQKSSCHIAVVLDVLTNSLQLCPAGGGGEFLSPCMWAEFRDVLLL